MGCSSSGASESVNTLQQLPQDSQKIQGLDENKRKGGWVNWIQPISTSKEGYGYLITQATKDFLALDVF
jgi:hypothetical protein